MPIPLHLRRQIGANRVASHSIVKAPPVEPVPVVETLAPAAAPVITSWSTKAKAATAPAPEPTPEPTPEAPEPTVEAPAVEPEPTPEPGVDFSQLKSTSLKSDLLAYTAHYGLPVDETNTKVEIWAAIEAHKASLSG
jgi:hypothetical protein